MIRRFAASLLSLSLLTTAAAAQQFAQPPSAGAPADAAEYMPRQAHAPSRALLIRALARRRAQNLARFHAYRTKGVFPHDPIARTTLNIWRDADGHLCAAATILAQDGQRALVDQVARDQNFVKLGEVTSGALYDWILTSGFTQVEVATIQEPFMGPREVPVRPDWRIAEDARLRRRYVRVEKILRDDTDDALAQAADRLAGNPELAWQLVGATSDA